MSAFSFFLQQGSDQIYFSTKAFRTKYIFTRLREKPSSVGKFFLSWGNSSLFRMIDNGRLDPALREVVRKQ